MTSVSTDRIEKQTTLRAPRARVWQAISDSNQFGEWFGARFDGPFVAGATVTARIVGTSVDPDVAQQQQPYADKRFDIMIETLEPERRLSFRWHPHAVDSNTDFANEPTTLVTFTLEDVPEGTRLTITESGFDRIPVERRAQAFTSNEQGWAIQASLLDKYLARTK